MKKQTMIEALLHEYDYAVSDLKKTLATISDEQLPVVCDPQTEDPDCESIQSVLTHIVHCGRKYLVMIDNHRKNIENPLPPRITFSTVGEYHIALEEMMLETKNFFQDIDDSEMVQHDPFRKLITFWGQFYDYEQLLEHAIVHVYRHRLQIEKFLRK